MTTPEIGTTRYAIPGFSRYTLISKGDTWTGIGARGKPLGRAYDFGDPRRQYFTLRTDTGDGAATLQLGRIVLIATIGPRPTPGHECCHWDGDPTNNRLDNLRWGTPEENQADSKRHARERASGVTTHSDGSERET